MGGGTELTVGRVVCTIPSPRPKEEIPTRACKETKFPRATVVKICANEAELRGDDPFFRGFLERNRELRVGRESVMFVVSLGRARSGAVVGAAADFHVRNHRVAS